MLQFEECKKCSEKRPIVNRTHNLCDKCNTERLRGINTKIKVNKPPTTAAKRESVIKTKLQDLKALISNKAQSEDRYYCWGCGKSEGPLDRSHIVSVRENKSLELCEQNINLLCRSCHIKWESGEIEKQMSLNCFESDLTFIKKNDNIRYQKFLSKITDLKNKKIGNTK